MVSKHCVIQGASFYRCVSRPQWSRGNAGLNPAEVDEFFQDVKILSTSSPGGTLSWGSRVIDFCLVNELLIEAVYIIVILLLPSFNMISS